MKRAANSVAQTATKKSKNNKEGRAATTLQRWWRSQLSKDDDPISLQRFPAKYGITLNKQVYNARQLAPGGVNRVPHTRRELTVDELDQIHASYHRSLRPPELAKKALDNLLLMAKDRKDNPRGTRDDIVRVCFDFGNNEIFNVDLYYNATPQLLAFGDDAGEFSQASILTAGYLEKIRSFLTQAMQYAYQANKRRPTVYYQASS